MSQALPPSPAPPPPDPRAAAKPVRELRGTRLGTLPWGTVAERRQSLAALYGYVVGAAEDAIGWYVREKGWKRRFGRAIRVLAILAVAAAALLPLLAQIDAAESGTRQELSGWTQPAWASVLILLAATLVGLDRFFGFSHGWMRYVDAQMKLTAALEQFDVDWQKHWVSVGEDGPSPEQTLAMLSACGAFAAQVRAIVNAETAEWIQEFRATLSQVDETVKARGAEAQSGIVNVTVTNGELAADGWMLTVDGGREVRHQGRTAALANLWPAAYRLRVEGRIGDQPVQAERAVLVRAGMETSVELTLA
jgi:hypothetical protein